MNSITHTIKGLASSLFLNIGLTKFAEKLDPIGSGHRQVLDMPSAMFCTACEPCNFTVSKHA